MIAPAIRANFLAPAAAAATSRQTAQAAEDFSDRLHERPGVAARNADTPDNPEKGLEEDGRFIDPATIRGATKRQNAEKAGSDGNDVKDDHKADDDKDVHDKDTDDQVGSALPLHVRAERTLVLAQPWQGANSAVPDPQPKQEAGGAGDSANVNSASPIAGRGTTPSGAAAAMLGIGGDAATNGSQATPSQPAAAQIAAATTPMMAKSPAVQNSVTTPISIQAQGSAAPAVGSSASQGLAASLAAASGSSQKSQTPRAQAGAGDKAIDEAVQDPAHQTATPSGEAPDMPHPTVQTKPASSGAASFAAIDGSSQKSPEPDGQAGTSDKAANNAVQVSAQQSTTVSGGRPDTPLPMAQMTPASGAAASFAGAVARGAPLDRYAAMAALASMPGAPAGGIPVQSLRIQLRPIELGAVTANIKYVGKQLSIDVEVETPDAQRRLSSDSSDIAKSLQSLGFQVDKITVRQVQPHAQAQTQTMQRDASAGGFGGGQNNTPFSMPGHSGGNSDGRQQTAENGYEDGSEHRVGAVQPLSEGQPRRGVFI